VSRSPETPAAGKMNWQVLSERKKNSTAHTEHAAEQLTAPTQLSAPRQMCSKFLTLMECVIFCP